jgi:hypothetical protein
MQPITNTDADGYTLQVRKDMIRRVLDRVTAKGIKPAPEVLRWYADYGNGLISRAQLMALIYARVDALSAKVAALF